jgi:tripartite-type tricarboxylate transporter receptor subunit TctC
MNKNNGLYEYRIVAASALALVCSVVGAQPVQNYPRKPIRLVVGFPAGGVADASARPAAWRGR